MLMRNVTAIVMIIIIIIVIITLSVQAHEELWFDCAQKLTSVIQQIIEFAKAVPGFRKFSQDDQIVLLKAGECGAAMVSWIT